MSNRTRTNRISRNLPKNIVKITVEDGREYYTYEKFRFLPEWLEYSESINDPKRELAFFDSISKYGCYEIEPTEIGGEDLDYFNAQVRPELDRQHEIMKKGGDI